MGGAAGARLVLCQRRRRRRGILARCTKYDDGACFAASRHTPVRRARCHRPHFFNYGAGDVPSLSEAGDMNLLPPPELVCGCGSWSLPTCLLRAALPLVYSARILHTLSVFQGGQPGSSVTVGWRPCLSLCCTALCAALRLTVAALRRSKPVQRRGRERITGNRRRRLFPGRGHAILRPFEFSSDRAGGGAGAGRCMGQCP